MIAGMCRSLSSERQRGSIYDVARQANVSASTVSRVFNQHPDVAVATRDMVLAAARRVNYMPRVKARGMSIGVVVQYIAPCHDVGLVSQLLSALARRVASLGVALEIVPIDDLDTVFMKHLHGLVAITYGPECRALGQIDHVPVVLINNRTPHPNFHYVCSDHADGARLAVRYLLKMGHRRIGFLEVRDDVWGARERESAYREVLSEAGVPVDPGLVCYCHDRPVREVIPRLWDCRPTAILVCGEDLSLAANRVLLQEMQLKIPDDVSVISYEIPLVSSILSPPQTTVAQPWEEISRRAVEGLVSLVEGTHRGRLDVTLPNTLIERQSVRNIGL